MLHELRRVTCINRPDYYKYRLVQPWALGYRPTVHCYLALIVCFIWFRKAKCIVGRSQNNLGDANSYSMLDCFCRSGLLNFCAVALALNELGYRAVGIRIDSGDLAYLSNAARDVFERIAQEYVLL